MRGHEEEQGREGGREAMKRREGQVKKRGREGGEINGGRRDEVEM